MTQLQTLRAEADNAYCDMIEAGFNGRKGTPEYRWAQAVYTLALDRLMSYINSMV